MNNEEKARKLRTAARIIEEVMRSFNTQTHSVSIKLPTGKEVQLSVAENFAESRAALRLQSQARKLRAQARELLGGER